MKHNKILVVDTDPNLLDLITPPLEPIGCEPRQAFDATEALSLLGSPVPYDAALIEATVAGPTGTPLLNTLRTHHPDLPIVVFSKQNDIHLAIAAFRRGAVDMLLAPFAGLDLQRSIAHAVEHGRKSRQETAYRKNLEEIVAARTGRLRATMQDLERSYDITLEAMGDALDLRDAETEGHSRRVTAYTIAIAQSMGLKADELRTIARGAFLHDLGKIATPDRILLKPGRLDPDEVTVMREHCAQGYHIVRKIPFLRDSAEIVYAHQESFDGTGYPRRLKGEEIPLGARIFAIADTLDVITSDRPYRKGATVAVATDEITRCSGQQFDPAIVDVFLRLPSRLWDDLRKEVSLLSASQLSRQLQQQAPAA
jgi:putative nucleotidyltransferase with HDIG domain